MLKNYFILFLGDYIVLFQGDHIVLNNILGFYIHFGHENKATWITIFNDLVQRKLSRVMMFISDDFSGITDAIKSVYPAAVTQKCLVHFLRNCKKNLT